jgi:DNA (cytosine-5)-methyltransferase 1
MASAFPLKHCISLFSGMGGDTLGMEQAGFQCVAFSENEPSCVLVHQDNFPECIHLKVPNISSKYSGKKQEGDIQSIPDSVFERYRDRIELIFAGFPCQGFSQAGKKDISDPRNQLFYEFVRVVNLVRPRWFIGENVPGLLTKMTDDNDCKVIDKILLEFNEIGYTEVYYEVLEATNYGVPQSRKRLLIVGFRDIEEGHQWKERGGFHQTSSCLVSSKPSIESILEKSLEHSISIPSSSSITCNDTIRISKEEMDILLEKWDIEKESVLCHPYIHPKLEDGEISYGKRDSPTYSEILDSKKPCKTLISTYCRMPRLFVSIGDDSVIPRRFIRTLTLKEGKQIQGFPEDFCLDMAKTLQSKWMMIGNAVPVPMVRHICETLLRES